MTALIQFLKGYLIICVSGFSPERFMNLCSNNGILLWDIKQENGKYEMCIFLKAFFKLRPIVRKTGVKVVIQKRIGLPFFMPKLMKRKTFIAGLLLTILVAVISAGFVWSIEISGNYQITDDVLCSFLEEKGVKIAVYKKRIDIDGLEKEIRIRFPQITWVCVKFSGTRLQISIKENDMPVYPIKEEKENGLDLVSSTEGKIVKMITRSGIPRVKIGDNVLENTILIEGKVPVFNEDGTVREYKYVDADGDIYIEHNLWYEETLDRKYRKKEYTGREQKHYYARVKDKTFSFMHKKKFLQVDNVIHESCPEVFDFMHIPIWFGTVKDREYQIYEKIYSEEEGKSILANKLLIFLESLNEKGVQIIEKNVKIEENEVTMKISGEITVWEKVEMRLPTQKSPEA